LPPAGCHHVEAGVIRDIAADAGADFQHQGVRGRAVLQAMAVAVIGLEAGGITGAEDFVAGIRHQRNLARDHIDELVAGGMPVALARPGTGRQPQQVDAELRQPGHVAEPGAFARPARRVVRRRIHRADHRRQLAGVDPFRHGSLR
jgi:hypothetical protein